MTNKQDFDVIIIGGSYAGLSAAMALGRSLRNVLIIDSGQPCNRQTPYAHNFITHDGETPKAIADHAKEQVLKYNTIQFYTDGVIDGKKTTDGFDIKTENGKTFTAKKLLFSTGVKDLMPSIPGFAECWGISVLHCPYCHGYEVKNENLGVIGNGDMGYEYTKLIHHWSENLTVFTNGPSTFTPAQAEKILSHGIRIIENEVIGFDHLNGKIYAVQLKDHADLPISAIFARAGFQQHTDVPEKLGCTLTEQGYIEVDPFYKTNIRGIYAAGDNTNMMRALSAAIAAGGMAGAMMNRELIDEEF